MNSKELKRIIKLEQKLYNEYMFRSRWRRIMGMIKCEPTYYIKKWQVVSRKTDYYKQKMESEHSFMSSFFYLYYIRKRNKYALKLGIEVSTENAGEGFFLYHYGATVINGSSIIGKNCRLHGNNCIGNAGPQDLRCPVIGNNVMIGVGAKIIGNVTIADDVKIAAGAVVVHSFNEKGITIGGIPAKKIK